jgi:hypothetical protein
VTLELGGLPVLLADTAGLRAEAAAADDVEREGMRRAVDRVAGQRRAQANLLPPTTRRGDPIIAEVLFEALEDASDTDALASPYPHGFHSWPAGMHPAIAATVLSGLLPLVPQGGVVDPFAGGGTVGLESLLHDRPFVGTDLNPLSRLVGSERCRPRSLTQVQAVATILAGVVERSKDRVRKKQPSRADVSPEIARQYAPHTLMELAGLLAEIDAVPKDRAEGIRSTLAVGFSAILTKVSNRRGDTDGKAGALKPGGADVEVSDDFSKRVGRFIPTERFEAKVHELLDKQQALHDVVGDDILPVSFFTADARDLPEVLGQKRASLILTSPPYGGTYDYTHHHAHRLAFLGLDAGADAQSFDRRELFARRRANPSAFDDETKQMLVASQSKAAARPMPRYAPPVMPGSPSSAHPPFNLYTVFVAITTTLSVPMLELLLPMLCLCILATSALVANKKAVIGPSTARSCRKIFCINDFAINPRKKSKPCRTSLPKDARRATANRMWLPLVAWSMALSNDFSRK